MPRPSAASLAVIGPSGIETIRRPEPPSELTQEQAIEWRAVVNRMAADWFPRETHGLLVQYCRLVVRARRLAQLIDMEEQSDEFNAKKYRVLVRAEEGISRAICSLATKMRISHQPTVRQDLARKPKLTAKNPWSND